MQYAHDKMNRDELDQVRRHTANHMSAVKWENSNRGRSARERWSQMLPDVIDDRLADMGRDVSLIDQHQPGGLVRRFTPGLTTRVIPQAVPELDTFDYEPVDVWTVNGRVI
jgi:hypothetical protein